MILNTMNDSFTMEHYRAYTPNTGIRNRVDPKQFANDSSIQPARTMSTNNNNNNSQACRRSSLAYFADESPGALMKVDLSFDKNEIFRPENVLIVQKQDESSSSSPLNAFNYPSKTISRKQFSFSDFRKRSSMQNSIVNESEDGSSRSGASTMSNSLFNLAPPLVSCSKDQQQLYDQQQHQLQWTCQQRRKLLHQQQQQQYCQPQQYQQQQQEQVQCAQQQQQKQQYGQQQQQYQQQQQQQNSYQQYGQQQQQQLQLNQYPMQSTTTMNSMVSNINPLKRNHTVEQLSPGPRPTKARFRSHQAESWMGKYEELLDFRLGNGHCLVPNQFPENPPLAEWVKRQRYQYKLKRLGKHSSMSDDRVAALEKLGFVWNSHDAVWEERLKELKQYKAIFGNTNVPSKYEENPQLAIWIKRQRRQYKFLLEGKPSTMTPYRVEKLREIDFKWSGRQLRAPAA